MRGTITNNDRLLQKLGVFGQGEIGGCNPGRTDRDRYRLGFVAQIGNIQGYVAGSKVADGIVSVDVGGRSGGAAFDRDIRADDGLIAFVHNPAGNGAGTLTCTKQRKPKQQVQQKGLSKACEVGVFHGLV